jgi:ribosome-associated protein
LLQFKCLILHKFSKYNRFRIKALKALRNPWMAKTTKKTAATKTIAKKSVTAPAKKLGSKKTSTPKTAQIAAAKKSPKKTPSKAPLTVNKTVKTKTAAKAKTANPAAAKTKVVKIAKSQAELLADAAIHGILEKKGRNVLCMDLRNVANAVADYFIICEADSSRQVSAIADSVDFEVKKATGENPFHTEGWENSLWVLLDYVNVVIHVFEAETRHFYRLESLWADAEVKEYGVEYA